MNIVTLPCLHPTDDKLITQNDSPTQLLPSYMVSKHMDGSIEGAFIHTGTLPQLEGMPLFCCPVVMGAAPSNPRERLLVSSTCDSELKKTND